MVEKEGKYLWLNIGMNTGDDYGNRMDRYFIGVAYLDGIPDENTE